MNGKTSLKKFIQVSLLATIGALLMLWQLPYPGATWLKVDFSDVPVLIGGFALGPMVGLAILFLKSILFSLVKFNPVELVGLPMNIIATGIMVVVATVIYQKKKTWTRALLAILAGICCSTIVMLFANYLMLPVFFRFFFPGTPVPSSSQLITMIITAVLPFNLIKGILNGTLTFLVYKRVSNFLRERGGIEVISATDLQAGVKR